VSYDGGKPVQGVKIAGQSGELDPRKLNLDVSRTFPLWQGMLLGKAGQGQVVMMLLQLLQSYPGGFCHHIQQAKAA
jgi:hypothetical protein